MSTTLRPAADAERASDFGEFWQAAGGAPPPSSLPPEPEAPPPPLTPEQCARRARLRRVVGGVMLGLSAFTLLAAGSYLVKGRASTVSNGIEARPSKPAARQAPAPAASSVSTTTPASEAAQRSASPPLPAAPERAPSDAERALALARAPIATAERLQTWSELARQLSRSDRKLAEHELSLWSVKGERPAQEAARLHLALLWRATDRRAKAHKVLVSLARTAENPLVKKYALATLTTA